MYSYETKQRAKHNQEHSKTIFVTLWWVLYLILPIYLNVKLGPNAQGLRVPTKLGKVYNMFAKLSIETKVPSSCVFYTKTLSMHSEIKNL